MARPALDELERRNTWIKYRVSRNEARRIEERAMEAGLSLSAYNRTLALEGAIIQPAPLADRELVHALSRIGNNLNQIARSVNISGELDPILAERLDGSLDQINGVIERLIA